MREANRRKPGMFARRWCDLIRGCNGAFRPLSGKGRPVLEHIIDTSRHPIHDPEYAKTCGENMAANNGLCELNGFLTDEGVSLIQREAKRLRSLAFSSSETHNAYLEKEDPSLPMDHPRNAQQRSTKTLVAFDQLEEDSLLNCLYHSNTLRSFVKDVMDLSELYISADPMNAVHLNYFAKGDELGWHFDNSEFFVNLILQTADKGGAFEFSPSTRRKDDIVKKVLEGKWETTVVGPSAGTLLIFRGRHSIHRVRPVENGERVTAILTYEAQPGVKMNEYTRKKFFGRGLEDPKLVKA